MDESTYHELADIALEKLYEFLEGLEDTLDDPPDVELQMGVLTVTLEAGRYEGRQYVINKHTPTQQIWVSSPLTGAGYFAYDKPRNGWYPTRTRDDGEELYEEITKEIQGVV